MRRIADGEGQAPGADLVPVTVWVQRFPPETLFLREVLAQGEFAHADGPSFEVSLNLSGGAGILCRMGERGDWYLLGPGQFASGVLDVADAAGQAEEGP